MKTVALVRLKSLSAPGLRTTAFGLALLLGPMLSCSSSSGGGGGPSPACVAVADLQPDSVTPGQLAAGDCVIRDLFAGTGDSSYVDQYRITLPEHGTLGIRLESVEFDVFVALLDSGLHLPVIAQDDNSGGGSDAEITIELDAGTYIILANSASQDPVTGAYTLTTTFAPPIWSPTSLASPPEARTEHTAVWTGSEMIVWGGQDGNAIAKNTGARLDPLTNVWTPISTVGAPSPRWMHTAVWTGTEMIVWGGFSGAPSFLALDDGAKYDPQTDTWQPVSAAGHPSARVNHTAVWTGSEMIVWGGFSCTACANPQLDTGARYDPAADAWTPTATANAPTARAYHTAVWTGSRMIVWGGGDDAAPGPPNLFASGGLYDPATDTWVATSLVGAPAPTRNHSAVWTGTEMIEFGGQTTSGLAPDTSSNGDGSRYDPIEDTWTSMTTAPVSSTFSGVRSVWTGSQLLTWFEGSGARYTPSTDVWNGISLQDSPSSRRRHSLVWTGSRMIVWGGDSGGPVDTGGIYDPAFDSTP